MVTKEEKQRQLRQAQDRFLRTLASYSNEGKTVRAREAKDLIGQFTAYKSHIEEIWQNVTLNEFVLDIGNGNYRITTRGVREINEYASQKA